MYMYIINCLYIYDLKLLYISSDSQHIYIYSHTFDNYAVGCGHCKRLASEYERAADKLSGDVPPVPLANVDVTEESSLANRFGINGYHTLKVIHNGVAYDYEGPHTAQDE